jgi:hypothetical protein
MATAPFLLYSPILNPQGSVRDGAQNSFHGKALSHSLLDNGETIFSYSYYISKMWITNPNDRHKVNQKPAKHQNRRVRISFRGGSEFLPTALTGMKKKLSMECKQLQALIPHDLPPHYLSAASSSRLMGFRHGTTTTHVHQGGEVGDLLGHRRRQDLQARVPSYLQFHPHGNIYPGGTGWND